MDDKSFLELKNRSLFARLKKLFSDEVIVRNIGGKKLKVADIHSIEYATDRNSLRDRFNRLRTSTTDNYSRDFNLAFQRNRTELFRDYDTMDMDPILHSALDVYADECLSSETIISLPGNKNYSIKELYDLNKKNFEVYSIDKSGKFTIQVCDHVAYNGKKEMYQITFDDNTIIKCTKNHLWRTNYSELKYTEELNIGDFLEAYKDNVNNPIRIIDIKKLDGLYDAYDLVNVGNSHLYTVKSNSGLNIVCHNCTTLSEMGELIKIYSSNEDIHDALENLFNDILNVRFNLWSWIRSLCKYGDFYLRLFISPDYGVYAVKPYSAYNVTRIENSDLSNRNYVKFQVTIPEGNRMEELENYEMIHFRLISDSNFMPQGLSMLEGGRRAWKQLSLLEDSFLIHEIMRAPEKRIFKIDVGNTPPNEIENLMNRIMNQMQKTPYMDSNGEYNLRYNMQNMIQDFYLPVRGNQSGTTIDTLPGLQWDSVNALEYIRNKMMAALKIPKAFLGYEESTGDKATLAQMDVRFCRTIQRIQKFVLSGLTEIAIIHLYSLGYRDENLLDFELELTNPSTIFEKEKIEIFKSKSELCQSMQEQKLFSKKWMYENIFGMSDQEIIELQKQLVDDSKANYRFSQIENEGSDPVLRFLKTQTPGPKAKKSDDVISGISSDISVDDTDISGGDDIFGDDNLDTETENSEEEDSNLKEGEKWKSPYQSHKNHNKMVKKKWDAKRDQTGRKDASKYKFGEDPLGDLEMNRVPKLKSPKIKAYEDSLYNRIYKEDKREFLGENDGKSYMDLDLNDKNELI